MDDRYLVIQIENLWYYSKLDDHMFFEWASRIPAMAAKLVADKTILYIDTDKLDDYALKEILGFFQRNRFSPIHLREIADVAKFAWLNDKSAYWYRRLFS